MNLYVQILTQCRTSEVVKLLLFPCNLCTKAVAGQVKVLAGPKIRRSNFEGVREITGKLASTRFNELEITYNMDDVKIPGMGMLLSVTGVLAVSPTCDLWFGWRDWPPGGDRTARNRRMNAKAAETGLSHYNVSQPSILETVISIDSTTGADKVLDAFAEWLAGSMPTDLEPLKVFGCVDAGGSEFFVKLESSVHMTDEIRVFAKLFPPTKYPELGGRFDALHPILFGDKRLCERIGQTLGKDAKVIPSRSLKDSAVLRLAPECDIIDASRRVSEWLLLSQVTMYDAFGPQLKKTRTVEKSSSRFECQMNTTDFWDLIANAKISAGHTKEIPQWLVDYLKEQPVNYIANFEEWLHEFSLRAYDARLWAAAGIMLGLCSDDKFDDFRGWLIAQGRDVYEAALNNPDSLADLESIDGTEGKPLLFHMLNAPTVAYRRKVDSDFADLPVSYRTPTLLNQDAWDGDRARLKAMFPKLCVKYRVEGRTTPRQ